MKICVCYTSVSQAISGQAIDRHLLGLKLTAAENGMETPGLFKDVAYSRSQHFRLSTSQVRPLHTAYEHVGNRRARFPKTLYYSVTHMTRRMK